MSIKANKLKWRAPPPPPSGPPPGRGSPDTVGSFGSLDRSRSPPPARLHPARFETGSIDTSHRQRAAPPPPPDHPPRFTPQNPSRGRSQVKQAAIGHQHGSSHHSSQRVRSPRNGSSAPRQTSTRQNDAVTVDERRYSNSSVNSIDTAGGFARPPGVFESPKKASPRVSPRITPRSSPRGSPRSSFTSVSESLGNDKSIDFHVDFSAAEEALGMSLDSEEESLHQQLEHAPSSDAVYFAKQAPVDHTRLDPAVTTEKTTSSLQSLSSVANEAKRRLSTEVASLTVGELASADLIEKLQKAHNHAGLSSAQGELVVQLQTKLALAAEKEKMHALELEKEENKHTEALRSLQEDFVRLQTLENEDDSQLAADLVDVDEAIRSTSMVIANAIEADRVAEGKDTQTGGAWASTVDAHFAAQEARVAQRLARMTVS